MKHRILQALFAATLCAVLPGAAHAANTVITLKDHSFTPREIVIPADRKTVLTIRNLDDTPAEFASWDLNREKTIDAKGEATIYVGPLPPGRYRFYDDYHSFGGSSRRDTTFGFITAK